MGFRNGFGGSEFGMAWVSECLGSILGDGPAMPLGTNLCVGKSWTCLFLYFEAGSRGVGMCLR